MKNAHKTIRKVVMNLGRQPGAEAAQLFNLQIYKLIATPPSPFSQILPSLLKRQAAACRNGTPQCVFRNMRCWKDKEGGKIS